MNILSDHAPPPEPTEFTVLLPPPPPDGKPRRHFLGCNRVVRAPGVRIRPMTMEWEEDGMLFTSTSCEPADREFFGIIDPDPAYVRHSAPAERT